MGNMEYGVEGLNKLAGQFHNFQIEAGFTNSDITQRLMLVHSEISEAFEAFRKDKFSICGTLTEHLEKGGDFKEGFEEHVKDTFEDEMADSIIRLLAMCAENDIDIEFHIQKKMRYNEMRGHKFGGKKF